LHGRTSCFCRDCLAKGRERDISIERARRGYPQLLRFSDAACKDQRPNDGYFVQFWRILLDYPEILAWEKLWTDSYHDVRSQLYGMANAIAVEKPFGWHISHLATFDPFYRAEENYAVTARYGDFFKPAIYNNPGGPRMGEFMKQWCSIIFHDAKPTDLMFLYYKILNLGHEAPYERLFTEGLGADYVARETRLIVAAVNKEAAVYPGVDIDVPTREGQKRITQRTLRIRSRPPIRPAPMACCSRDAILKCTSPTLRRRAGLYMKRESSEKPGARTDSGACAHE
jgi:hypothetical protein